MPALEDGIVVFVKRDCPTCELIEPALAELASNEVTDLTVLTQDDPSFPALDGVIDDTSLEHSWHRDIETVPTALRVANGEETERIVGWDRDQWRAFTGVDELGDALPEHRPGCGSLSVDPDLSSELAVRFGGSTLRSRRVEIASLEDEIEAMFDRGWSDGLPVVPPSEIRVMRMLEGTTRSPDDIVAVVPPNLVEATVEKVAIAAVMAGCKPEYLPVVLASVEAVCTDEFNMHGVLATTMGVGPVLVVNGPIRRDIGMNTGINVLGHGNRANSTIGRAVQLLVRNFGGGAPGGVDRAAHGQPGKIGFCFAEDEEDSPWSTLGEDQGFDREVSTVTAFTGEAPRIIVDQLSRTPESLTALLAQSSLSTISSRTVMGMDAMLVICPEHMARYRDAGWDKARFREEFDRLTMVDTDTIVRGVDGIDEGLPVEFGGSQLPKFRPGGLHILHAGGPAGLFSSIIGGWVSGEKGSVAVTKEITR